MTPPLLPPSLVPLALADAAALGIFETRNRAFFEASINARPPAFYAPGGVEAAVAQALADARADRGYQYLLKEEGGEIVGRFNLSGVRRAHFQSATLGYRIAESACGKGYASVAVRQMLERAFGELGLMRIEADARIDNAASIRVLTRNGFVQYGHSRRSFEHGGAWHDRLHFERHRPAAESAPP
ncbi:GNAT family N-acetyltransferase [Massilia sp. Dwa41.01b]|uniref:GNAT family N-acetyltransferase n=1 Tax=unclassified Massilia TaxID=2609279 RepID=UPI001602F907|nr:MULTISPECIES: GNAT family protein [unclassified Massilia]QNA89848.1 GNAT family N-acetyltransferase [Massilia sp. Dwa41.01b]QNB00739.1 GNAT family N-acetyltransferase [Massilia sp. Se16.2.3]